MLDLETLGTTADAVIMSVGAVIFDPSLGVSGREDDKFYASLSVESQLGGPNPRRICEATLQWWFRQEAAAQQVFHEPKQEFAVGLYGLADWIASHVADRRDVQVWAKPSKFDVAMLEHGFKQMDSDAPWEHWASNCLTGLVKTATRVLGVDNLPPKVVPEIAHNALHDAIAQAQYTVALTRALGGAR